jgi:pantoate--beta-alanine ligase
LYRCLQRAQERVDAGDTDARRIQQELEKLIAEETLATLDYVALVNSDTLEPVASLAASVTLVAIAVHIGKTRLIDNALIAPEGTPIPKNRLGRV